MYNGNIRERVVYKLNQLDLIRDSLFIPDTPRKIKKSWHLTKPRFRINSNGKNNKEFITKLHDDGNIDPIIYKYWFVNIHTKNVSLIPPRTYNINKEKLQKYIDSQCTLEAKLMASWMAEVTKHVTFDEFYNKLVSCIERFNEAIINIDKPYVLIVPEEAFQKKKSNAWLFLLTLSIFNPQPSEIRTQTKNIKGDIDEIVFLDDGIYSGLQLGDFIKYNVNVLSEDPINLRCHIITPFVSEQGLNHIKEWNKTISITFYYETIMVSLYNQIIPLVARDLDLDLDSAREWLLDNFTRIITTFGVRSYKPYNIIPIYFDHKLPDSVSSIPYVYYGYISTDRNKVNNTSSQCFWNNPYKVPFIDGCLNATKECPPPFYKNF